MSQSELQPRRFEWDGTSSPSNEMLDAIRRSAALPVIVLLGSIASEQFEDWEAVAAERVDHLCRFAGANPQLSFKSFGIMADAFSDEAPPLRQQYPVMWPDQTIGELVAASVVSEIISPEEDRNDYSYRFYVPAEDRLIYVDTVMYPTEAIAGYGSGKPGIVAELEVAMGPFLLQTDVNYAN